MGYIFIAIALMAIGDYTADFLSEGTSTVSTMQVSSIAGSLIIYGQAVIAYARANPGITGTVAVASLNLPYWVNTTRSDLQLYAVAGRGFAYYAGPVVPGLAGQVSAQGEYAVTSGTVTGGQIASPRLGAVSSITVPNVIPNGSVVVTD